MGCIQMRSDMSKVLCEVRRYQWADSKVHRIKDHIHNDPDNLPLRAKVSMGRHGTKSFTDLLGPLKKYLRRQVGRPWDKVYSEVSKHIRPSSTVQRHLLGHLFQMIAIHVEEEDGHVSPKPPSRSWLVRGNLYVCPRSNIIKVYEPCQERCCRVPPEGRWLSETSMIRLLHGRWARITFAPIPARSAAPDAVDAVLRRPLFGSGSRADTLQALAREHKRAGVYALQVCWLSSWERARYGLPTGPR